MPFKTALGTFAFREDSKLEKSFESLILNGLVYEWSQAIGNRTTDGSHFGPFLMVGSSVFEWHSNAKHS